MKYLQKVWFVDSDNEVGQEPKDDGFTADELKKLADFLGVEEITQNDLELFQ